MSIPCYSPILSSLHGDSFFCFGNQGFGEHIRGMQTAALCSAASQEVGKGEGVRIANYLCNGNYAVSGGIPGCEVVERIAKPDYKARMTVRLAVAGAFHTDFMQPAVEKLRSAFSELHSPSTFLLLTPPPPPPGRHRSPTQACTTIFHQGVMYPISYLDNGLSCHVQRDPHSNSMICC